MEKDSEQHDPALVKRVVEMLPAVPDIGPTYEDGRMVGYTIRLSLNAWNAAPTVARAIIDAVRAWDREHGPRGIMCAQCHGTGTVAFEDLAMPPEPSEADVDAQAKDEHTVRDCAGDSGDVNCIDGLDCPCPCHYKCNLTVDGLLRFMEFYKDGYAVVDAAIRARLGWPK